MKHKISAVYLGVYVYMPKGVTPNKIRDGISCRGYVWICVKSVNLPT